MQNLVLIQARMGSSRFPNKVLKDLCGKPDLQWVIERVKRSRMADEVVVVTSIEKENLPLLRLCIELGVRVYVGSENDVLDRYYQAAKLLRPKRIVRVTADCPLFDWRYLDKALEELKDNTDYLWMGENGFPDGLDLEIIRFEALERAWKDANMQSEREHVTPYFRNNPKMFSVQVYDFPIKGIGHYRWTLDEEKDYKMIREIYRYFVSLGKEDFVTEDVLAFLKEHPEIEEINGMIQRNEGLAKSIREDKVIGI